MTGRIPPVNFWDKIVRLSGKEREVIIPEGAGTGIQGHRPLCANQGQEGKFFQGAVAHSRKT